jgi:hypothetical protein
MGMSKQTGKLGLLITLHMNISVIRTRRASRLAGLKKHSPLLLLVAVSLVVGVLIVPGYGEGMDELMQRDYGERTVRVYESLVTTGTAVVKERPRQGSHGPAFIMVVTLLKRVFLPLGSAVQKLEFGHYIYFLMFQVGVISLYFLARRWVGALAAFGTALLFATQPLLVGHAFINPKDIVFMSLLIANAVLGLRLVDSEEAALPAAGGRLQGALRSLFRQFLRADVWLAGFLLGFASAVRIAAPLIGLVVLGYLAVCRKWQTLPRLFAYGSIALCFMFLFWPYLWSDPIGRLIEVTLNSANYPDIHLTLFRGALVDAQHTPRSYLPVLLAVQLTETALLLMLVGAVALLKTLRRDLAVLISIWFVLPVLLLIGLRVNLYNNFRQVFFILPPLFLLAGLGLDWLLRLVRRPVFRSAVLFLAVLPALYANINLYPYQYVYYNQLAGGLGGAYRVFELDYWQVAFREAQAYVNRNAGRDANIYAGGAKQTAQTFARNDLTFNALGGRKRDMNNYDYVIVSTAQNEDAEYADLPTVFLIERDGVPLAYVKKPK